jgi:hypothetical protein
VATMVATFFYFHKEFGYNYLQSNILSAIGLAQFQKLNKKVSKRTGYEMEKWHWSYIPISSNYLKKYNELVNYKLVNGFKGSYFASKIKSIENFVNGIDQTCQH